jgi:hypothetical protein
MPALSKKLRDEKAMTERERLKREIKLLAQTIEANAVTLASKTMTLDDREALKRQMTIRIAHQRLLERRLDRLHPAEMNRPDICANEQPFEEIAIVSLRRSRWIPTPQTSGL